MSDTESEKEIQEKLLDLHNKIIELEKLEILRKKIITKPLKIENSIHKFFKQSKACLLLIQDRKIAFLSPGLAAWLGFSDEQMIGTPFASYVHPDELPKVVKYYLLRMTGEKAPPLYDTVIKHKDGRDIPVAVRAGIVPYHGKPADFVILGKPAGQGGQ